MLLENNVFSLEYPKGTNIQEYIGDVEIKYFIVADDGQMRPISQNAYGRHPSDAPQNNSSHAIIRVILGVGILVLISIFILRHRRRR
jgi:hypothetical protein